MAGQKKQTQKTKPEVRKTPDLTEIHKTFQKDGRWIERKEKTPILICICGNRYIKTRKAQTVCLRCIAYGRTGR